MKNIGLVTFFVLALMSVAVCGATRVKSCFVKDKTFPTSSLTHVDTHLETAEECQDSCTDDCAGFTWINHNSSLLPKICALFNSTDTQIDCADCVSGPKECSCYFYGECEMTDDILVGVHEHVDDMASCHSLCKVWDNQNCKHFTYYTGDSEFPHICFLFSDCAKNNTDCGTDCVHGPTECNFCSLEETEDGTCSEYGGGAVAHGWGSTGNASTTTTTPTTTTTTTTPTTTTTTTTPTTTTTAPAAVPAVLVFGGSSTSNSGKAELLNISHSSNGLCGESNSIPALSYTYSYRSRGTVTKNGTIVTCGSMYSSSTNNRYCWYLGASNKWIQGPSLPSTRYYGRMETIGNYIYFFGGYYSSSYYTTIYALKDDFTGSWSSVDSMSYSRAYFCSVATSDSIIMIGGQYSNGNYIRNNVEEWWPTTKVNKYLSSMTTKRMQHGCALIASNSAETVYAAGGYSGSYLKSVERMTRSSGGSWGSWAVVGNLPVSSYLRLFPMISWSDGRMYTLGGYGSSVSKQIFSSANGASWRTENITLPTVRYHHWAISTENLC